MLKVIFGFFGIKTLHVADPFLAHAMMVVNTG